MDSRAIIERLGGPTKVAELCGGDVTPQAVSQWYGEGRNIPKGWLRFLQTIRPEVFDAPEAASKAS